MAVFTVMRYSSKYVSYVALAFLSLILVSCTEKDEFDNVVRNDDCTFSDKDLLIRAINLNCKYVLTDWWNGSKDMAFQNSYLPNWESLSSECQAEISKSSETFLNWTNEEFLYIPNWRRNGNSENAILPPSYACRILSSAIHYGIYNSGITGVSQHEAIQKTALLIKSVVKCHCSNDKEGWGNCWQGALWAEMLGMSAFLLKDYMPSEVWNMVCNMIRSECDYVINVARVKFYKDRLGNILEGCEGDSQSETDAWNATILALAMVVMPNDSNLDIWRKSFVELNVAAMTCPSDVFIYDKCVDGFFFIDACGSNINEDGTVTNHSKQHIDYMASPIESFAESSIVLSFGRNNRCFDCLKFNVDKIYNALVDLDLGEFNPAKSGHHFYERSTEGGGKFSNEHA